ncbi:CD99 antigen-like isoform X2 [Lepisosteus oculatus]|uniref:CD99 antigen-like isoform X2 n=1 Tax=Lepisosteus oculatus TaxID=7918 RepID=UPI00073FE9E5|nr:PREDICTED: CD99 antigen-like isoform X2 [Lepisosteus oculatus]
MKYLRILLFAILTIVAQGQDGFDLSDALGGSDPVTAKPKPKPPKDTGTGDFNLGDVFDMPGPTKPPVTPKPKKPSGDEFDLGDALGGPDPHPTKQPAVPPKNPGKGGSFDNDDLGYVAGEGDYNPDKGKSGGRSGGRAEGDTQGGSDQPQDLEHQWRQLLKLLNDNMPESVRIWITNLKQVVVPLFERVMEILDMKE